MVEVLLTLFCLVISFGFNSKKMKVLSYVQAVFSFVLFLLVLILSPVFTFIYEKNLTALEYIKTIHDVVMSCQYQGFSIIKTILFAIVFLTILSIFTIIEYIKYKKCKPVSESKVLIQKKKYLNFFYLKNDKKMYLRLCRLLN